ncbi:MAG TPA: DUF2157 domain-containing protein [Actinomycetota bacterium]
MARDDDLQRWTDAGLIRSEQRGAILEHERARTVSGSRIPAVVEVLIYLGAAAVSGAVIALLSDVWEDLSTPGRFTLLALLSVAAGVGGAVLRGPGNTPITRAASVLWLLSVGFLVFALIGVGADEPEEAWQGLLLVGGPSLVLAAAYQRLQPRAPQMFAVFGTAITVALGLSDLVTPLGETSGGIAVALVGAGAGALTRAGRLTPEGVAYALAGITLLAGMWIPGFEDGGAWAEALAIAFAAALLGASVAIRSTHLLIVGALGLFLFVTTSVMRHFADTIGVPVALLLVGVLLIGSAVMVARLRPMTRAE